MSPLSYTRSNFVNLSAHPSSYFHLRTWFVVSLSLCVVPSILFQTLYASTVSCLVSSAKCPHMMNPRTTLRQVHTDTTTLSNSPLQVYKQLMWRGP
ncbi:hypothetical protein BCV70DRAFT_73888 [Testicularia cyperi]|uniref:Uncharacterized protein n=1 Tax=Testicularia cyperi TaxID=1882483 RepID=A0A317XSZ1_9BASI|nr:hypothetical protein BCV70DRAFT_73888 [Testicularia cyperi]